MCGYNLGNYLATSEIFETVLQNDWNRLESVNPKHRWQYHFGNFMDVCRFAFIYIIPKCTKCCNTIWMLQEHSTF